MRISARCDYACRALLELSLHWPNTEPLKIQVISQRQDIPLPYLVQILLQLKRMGMVVSSRGKEGGYNLSRPPRRISLGGVVRQIGETSSSLVDSHPEKKDVFADIWAEAARTMAKVLDKITFEDICNRVKGRERTIAYQI